MLYAFLHLLLRETAICFYNDYANPDYPQQFIQVVFRIPLALPLYCPSIIGIL